MEVFKIYFDMDGVLADFTKGVETLCNAKYSDQLNRDPVGDEAMWDAIKKVGHFYDKLEPMPGAIELFFELYEKYGSRCEILTGIPKPKHGVVNASEDKIKWTRRLLGEDIKINVVFKEDKPDFCHGKGFILIDDLITTIEKWKERGGIGILHVSSEDTRGQLKKLSIL